MATATSLALSRLSQEQGGIGSAVLQAVSKVGSPFGAAVLGSVLSAGYLTHLDVTGLPARSAALARLSVFGGVALARRTGSATLLRSVHAAFIHGMNLALTVSAAVAGVGFLLAWAFLPTMAGTVDVESGSVLEVTGAASD
jgi:hypothetical protein